jgi:hypothetical protein
MYYKNIILLGNELCAEHNISWFDSNLRKQQTTRSKQTLNEPWVGLHSNKFGSCTLKVALSYLSIYVHHTSNKFNKFCFLKALVVSFLLLCSHDCILCMKGKTETMIPSTSGNGSFCFTSMLHQWWWFFIPKKRGSIIT